MTVLVVGGSGFLGTELVHQASAAGHSVAATFATRPCAGPEATWHRADLRDGDHVEEIVASLAPCVVINASSGSANWAVTAEGSVRLAMTAAKYDCRLVHVSSDAVFSGTRVRYDESCRPDPVTPYGAAKAAAETGIRLLDPDAVIARTSLIIGDIQSEHVRLVHDLATGSRSGALFTDDIRCPVHVDDLAAALLELAFTDACGVHHLAGADAVSRHRLGVLIAQRDGLDASRLPEALRATTALPGALDVRLDSRATQAKLRTRLRGVHEFL
ncbi:MULTISPECIES: sugar nucleotide-binding protein [unclassified Streptomyces]|uniref:SDR family oxidoreductase n=1 Tax=unclassified Streptomyces TaxID=2593676 RepID=UPI002E16CDA5|nr:MULTISPECIES: sugar nucleotide-binding protein [unclassified Streptomyces]